jgi:rSAM/selenodomain-associated transferase 2
MISVVIPTLNEEQCIGTLIDSLQDASIFSEVIVVDGGSTDSTLSILDKFLWVKVISAPKSRAQQMNEGAKLASGQYLLFMHADSYLSKEAINSLPQLIDNFKAGAFSLQFDGSGIILQLYAWFTKFNWTITTFGDQGLFIDKKLFKELRGFRNLPIMEDLDMVRRIKKKTKFQKFSASMITSSRRYEANGHIRQQLINIVLVLGFYLGVSPHFLSRFYRY